MEKINDIILTIIAGGLLGIIGQGIRVAVGFKKLNETRVTNPTNPADPVPETKETFDTSRLLLSIFLGFIAGAIALICRGTTAFDKEVAFAIIASGYAGADFIEGFFTTYIKK
jgi:hypothetical protein